MQELKQRIATLFLILFALPVMAQGKPNIVLVFMDNFGWGEPGFNGGGIVRGAETPRLDQLAAEGLRLTNFNVDCFRATKPAGQCRLFENTSSHIAAGDLPFR